MSVAAIGTGHSLTAIGRARVDDPIQVLRQFGVTGCDPGSESTASSLRNLTTHVARVRATHLLPSISRRLTDHPVAGRRRKNVRRRRGWRKSDASYHKLSAHPAHRGRAGRCGRHRDRASRRGDRRTARSAADGTGDEGRDRNRRGQGGRRPTVGGGQGQAVAHCGGRFLGWVPGYSRCHDAFWLHPDDRTERA
jgi:hypothetical protein